MCASESIFLIKASFYTVAVSPPISSAGVHGGAGARGAVPAIRPEWGSAGDSEAPHVQD